MAFGAGMTGYRHALPALWQQPVAYEPDSEVPYAPQPALAPSGGALTPSPGENAMEFVDALAPIAGAAMAGGPAGLLLALAAGTAAQTFRGQKQRERQREIELRAAQAEADKEAEQTAWDRGIEVEKLRIEQAKLAGSGKWFEGSGIEAQALNQYIESLPPEEQEAAAIELAKQKLSRETTVVTPEGTRVIPGYQLDGRQPEEIPRKPTEREKTAEFVAGNLADLEARVEAEEKNFDPTSVQAMAAEIPVVGNFLASGAQQRHRAAAAEWTTNVVFMRSGATARADEIDAAYQNYFPQPGDSEETVKAKKAMRAEMMAQAERMGREAGRIPGPSKNQAEPGPLSPDEAAELAELERLRNAP